MTEQQTSELVRKIRQRVAHLKAHPEEARPILERVGVLSEDGSIRPEAADVMRFVHSHEAGHHLVESAD